MTIAGALRHAFILRLRHGFAIPPAGIRIALDVKRLSGAGTARRAKALQAPRGRWRCIALGDINESFSRPDWQTLDLREGADFQCDFRKDSLPFPDESLDAVHSSHMIEHISAADGRSLFREIYRCLRPGGALRLSTPDLALLIDRYQQGDWRWFLEADGRYVLENVIGGGMPPELLLMHNRLVGWIASYSGRLDTGGGPIVDKALVDEKLAQLDRYGFRDWCVSLLEPRRIYAHIHLYDYEELARELNDAGFSEVRRCSFGETQSADMKDPPIDREKHRLYSLYVEALR